MTDQPTTPSARPVYLVIQGRLNPGADAIYAEYLEGTRPLLMKYGGEVAAVGEGVVSPHTTVSWPINGLLRFPSLQAAEGFLGDPVYLEIKTRYRNPAYEVLNLSLFLGRQARAGRAAGGS
jgi:uncharacterized protein (DUF1330 family)